jgi:pantetheine-phosphate adenylyltransferase
MLLEQHQTPLVYLSRTKGGALWHGLPFTREVFDPITYGHFDMIERALPLFDRLHVTIAVNPDKDSGLLSLTERRELIEAWLATKDFKDKVVVVDAVKGMLVKHCRHIGAHFIVRGLRAVSDFDYEFQVYGINRDQAPDIQTIWFPASPEFMFVSSKTVKGIFKSGADISKYVPPLVEQKMRERIQQTTYEVV